MTTIYLVRHSKTLKVNDSYTKDSLQIQNEKKILSLEGEALAEKHFSNEIFNNIDCVYSSNYIRAISTAKYVAEKNNIEINIIDDLGERKFGINTWDELPNNFERKQFLDEDYKIVGGESQREVRKRMKSAIMQILNENREKKILIVSHGTAISFLLKEWCDIELVEEKLQYNFNGKNIFNGYLNNCETFKLEFDNDYNLIGIKNINTH